MYQNEEINQERRWGSAIIRSNAGREPGKPGERRTLRVPGQRGVSRQAGLQGKPALRGAGRCGPWNLLAQSASGDGRMEGWGETGMAGFVRSPLMLYIIFK